MIIEEGVESREQIDFCSAESYRKLNEVLQSYVVPVPHDSERRHNTETDAVKAKTRMSSKTALCRLHELYNRPCQCPGWMA